MFKVCVLLTQYFSASMEMYSVRPPQPSLDARQTKSLPYYWNESRNIVYRINTDIRSDQPRKLAQVSTLSNSRVASSDSPFQTTYESK